MEFTPESEAALVQAVLVTFGGVLLVGILMYAFYSLMLVVLARKTRTSGAWLGLIPIANIFLMCRIARQPAALALCMLIPGINVFVFFFLWASIAKACGKSGLVGVLVPLPLLGLLALAYLALAAVPGDGQRVAHGVAAHSFCPACGSSMRDTDRFCGACGSPLAGAEPMPQEAAAPSRGPLVALAMAAFLAMAVGGIYFGSRHVLGTFLSDPARIVPVEAGPALAKPFVRTPKPVAPRKLATPAEIEPKASDPGVGFSEIPRDKGEERKDEEFLELLAQVIEQEIGGEEIQTVVVTPEGMSLGEDGEFTGEIQIIGDSLYNALKGAE